MGIRVVQGAGLVGPSSGMAASCAPTARESRLMRLVTMQYNTTNGAQTGNRKELKRLLDSRHLTSSKLFTMRFAF